MPEETTMSKATVEQTETPKPTSASRTLIAREPFLGADARSLAGALIAVRLAL
jgi:hypothetical protein